MHFVSLILKTKLTVVISSPSIDFSLFSQAYGMMLPSLNLRKL